MIRSTFALSIVFIIGCGKGSEQEAPPADNPDVQEARQTFQTLCVTCHGESGRGDGIAAKNLDPKPRNYTDKAWQASVTDDQIKEIIVKGGAGVGKSPVMPASPQFEHKPGVLNELVRIVRSFGK
ncbi:MAG: c-type cytochrome [Kofleriaceae bacterium]|nr:c-type cytochrome [Kofleriaceae bacterium]